MQMWHRFTGIGSVVDNKPVTALLEAELRRNFGGFQKQMAEHLMILRLRVAQSRNGPAWNDQHMHRSSRIDIANGEDKIVLVNDVTRDLTSGNFFKQSFAHSE